MDFLKSFPSVTRDDYLWRWTVPQVLLASYDFTHLDTDTRSMRPGKNGKKRRRKPSVRTFDSPVDFVKTMNVPVMKKTI